MGKRKERIFKINNIILSAFSENKDIKSVVEKENDEFSSCMDSPLKDEYKVLKSGAKISLASREEPDVAAASEYIKRGNYARAFGLFAQLLKTSDDIEIYKSAASSLLYLKQYNIVLDYFIPKLLPYKDDDIKALDIIATTYFSVQKHYKDSIPLLEKLLELNPDSTKDYNFKLAYMYERVYQDKKLDTQIKYAERALKEIVNKNFAYILLSKLYYRKGDKKRAKEYLDKMMSNNPTPDDIVAYGRFYMKEGEITKGYDIYRVRFDTGNVAYPKPLLPEKRWDGKKDLSNSTVIVHYEQGFGDSIMFCRYIPELAKKAKKIIFVVQKNIIPLLKSSGFDKFCEILSHEADVNPNLSLENSNRSVMYSGGEGMSKIEHDFHIPLMDTPFLMKESPDKMYQAGGYLKTDKKREKEFRAKYINKNKKIKIGLAYHGTDESILTYRDISVKKFLPLFDLKGVEFYSFQADKYADELKKLDKNIQIKDLGKCFNDFEDTACAINCMDLIVSTDNVVMNLAGALGVKTYGLFNVFTESRWYKTEGDDIGWYKSVRPFRAKTFNDWDNLILEVKQAIINDFKSVG